MAERRREKTKRAAEKQKRKKEKKTRETTKTRGQCKQCATKQEPRGKEDRNHQQKRTVPVPLDVNVSCVEFSIKMHSWTQPVPFFFGWSGLCVTLHSCVGHAFRPGRNLRVPSNCIVTSCKECAWTPPATQKEELGTISVSPGANKRNAALSLAVF